MGRRPSTRPRTVSTAGMQLLSSILHHRSATTLRDIRPDDYFENEPDERRVYDFIHAHFQEHRALPTADIVATDTGITLPDTAETQPTTYYMSRLRQRTMTRSITEPYNRLSEALQRPRQSVTEIEEAILDMYRTSASLMTAGTGIELSDSILHTIMEEAGDRQMSGGMLGGITTGWEPVDEAMDGYNRGDLVVWVGRPGRSKSWLLLKQCHAAWVAGWKPLYVSMEMGALQNMRRILGIHSGVNPTIIKRGEIPTLARPMLDTKLQELLELRPLHMVTANFSRTVDQIANFIDEFTPDIVYIDAGYLLTPKKKRYGSSGRRESISDVIEELKELATNANIPFVITVQFNRNAEQRRRGANARRSEGEASVANPLAHLSLAEIGETDVIGQAATHVFGIEYPPFPIASNSCRVFGFLKGREGESGWWACNFMRNQHAHVDLSILERDHPIYQQIVAQPSGNPRQRRPGDRSAVMRLQD